jgi:hypothetical protein
MFPVDVDENIRLESHAGLMIASGKDRTVHFFHHFFLASRYIGLSLAGNQDAGRVPAFIKPILFLSGNVFEKALTLSELAGAGWELKETADTDLTGNYRSQPGILDPASRIDLAANRFGAIFALNTFGYLSDNKEKSFDELLSGVREIFEELETPYFKKSIGILRADDSSGFFERYYSIDYYSTDHS